MAKVPQEFAKSMKVAYEQRQSEKKTKKLISVSYTHLTLPTIYSV